MLSERSNTQWPHIILLHLHDVSIISISIETVDEWLSGGELRGKWGVMKMFWISEIQVAA